MGGDCMPLSAHHQIFLPLGVAFLIKKFGSFSIFMENFEVTCRLKLPSVHNKIIPNSTAYLSRNINRFLKSFTLNSKSYATSRSDLVSYIVMKTQRIKSLSESLRLITIIRKGLSRNQFLDS